MPAGRSQGLHLSLSVTRLLGGISTDFLTKKQVSKQPTQGHAAMVDDPNYLCCLFMTCPSDALDHHDHQASREGFLKLSQGSLTEI
jgi:hypothetical protein